MRIVLSGEKLTLEEVGAAARGGARVEIAAKAGDRVRAARTRPASSGAFHPP